MKQVPSKLVKAGLACFGSQELLQALKESAALETVSITSLVAEEEVDRFAIDFHITASDLQRAADGCAAYCTQVYPKCRPLKIWMAAVPESYLAGLGWWKRRQWRSEGIVRCTQGELTAYSSRNEAWQEIISLAFDDEEYVAATARVFDEQQYSATRFVVQRHN